MTLSCYGQVENNHDRQIEYDVIASLIQHFWIIAVDSFEDSVLKEFLKKMASCISGIHFSLLMLLTSVMEIVPFENLVSLKKVKGNKM